MVKQSRACSTVDRHRVNGKAVQTHAKVGKIAVADCQSSDKKGSWRSWFVAPGAYEILRPLPCGRWTCHMCGTDGAKLSSSVAVANVQLHPLPFSRYCGRAANEDGGRFDTRPDRSVRGRFAGGVQGRRDRASAGSKWTLHRVLARCTAHATIHPTSLETGLRARVDVRGGCSFPDEPTHGGRWTYTGAPRRFPSALPSPDVLRPRENGGGLPTARRRLAGGHQRSAK